MTELTLPARPTTHLADHHTIGRLLNTPTPSQINVLRAAESHEAGGNWSIQRWSIQRSTGLDCIEHGWLTEDYYLTDLSKRILSPIS
jgi:hypothetical protein